MLEIPHIHDVPRTWRAPGPKVAAARTALALLDRGLITRGDGTQPADLVAAGLRRWLQQHTGTLQTMRVRLSYNEVNAEAGITLAVDMNRPLWIGRRVEALERSIPGLGETVLWHLQRDLPSPLEIVTPEATLYCAMHMEWGGQEDEADQLAQYLSEGEKREDIDIITRAQFDKQIPRWASAPREHQKPRALSDIAKHWRRPRIVAQTAGAVLALHKARGVWISRDDGLRCWPPVQVLKWKAGDTVTVRLADSFGNMLFESGEYMEDFTELDLKNPAAWSETLTGFMAAVEPKLRALRAADRVLQLIGDRRG